MCDAVLLSAWGCDPCIDCITMSETLYSPWLPMAQGVDLCVTFHTLMQKSTSEANVHMHTFHHRGSRFIHSSCHLRPTKSRSVTLRE